MNPVTLQQTYNFLVALYAPYLVTDFYRQAGRDFDNWKYELRVLPPKGTAGKRLVQWFEFSSVGARAAAAFVHSPATSGKDVYVGVLPRRDDQHGGTGEAVAAVGAITASIDQNADVRTAPGDLIRNARLLVEPGKPAQGLPAPHIIVHSGGGLHVVWLLPEPMLLAKGDAPALQKADGTIKRLAKCIGGAAPGAAAETSVYPSYLIRVPGSWNNKPAYLADGGPRPVRLIRLNDQEIISRSYYARNLTWWRSHLPPDPAAPARRPMPIPMPEYPRRGDRPLRGEEMLSSTVPPGQRHPTAVKGAALLSSAGVPADQINAYLENFAAINGWRTQPGEIAKITQHYARKDGHHYV